MDVHRHPCPRLKCDADEPDERWGRRQLVEDRLDQHFAEWLGRRFVARGRGGGRPARSRPAKWSRRTPGAKTQRRMTSSLGSRRRMQPSLTIPSSGPRSRHRLRGVAMLATRRGCRDHGERGRRRGPLLYAGAPRERQPGRSRGDPSRVTSQLSEPLQQGREQRGAGRASALGTRGLLPKEWQCEVDADQAERDRHGRDCGGVDRHRPGGRPR